MTKALGKPKNRKGKPAIGASASATVFGGNNGKEVVSHSCTSLLSVVVTSFFFAVALCCLSPSLIFYLFIFIFFCFQNDFLVLLRYMLNLFNILTLSAQLTTLVTINNSNYSGTSKYSAPKEVNTFVFSEKWWHD